MTFLFTLELGFREGFDFLVAEGRRALTGRTAMGGCHVILQTGSWIGKHVQSMPFGSPRRWTTCRAGS